jgi:hypothetical protein
MEPGRVVETLVELREGERRIGERAVCVDGDGCERATGFWM